MALQHQNLHGLVLLPLIAHGICFTVSLGATQTQAIGWLSPVDLSEARVRASEAAVIRAQSARCTPLDSLAAAKARKKVGGSRGTMPAMRATRGQDRSTSSSRKVD